jgi:DMSO/TMAO reductase YedYZ heme-binding membrane subunit
VWHFYWQVKRDVREPLLYIFMLSLLLGYRIVVRWQARRRVTSNSRTGPSLRPSASD